jgi:septum formation protein
MLVLYSCSPHGSKTGMQKMNKSRTIVLASASPRRKEILAKTGLKFRVDKSVYEEKFDPAMKPHTLAKCLSRGKARNVARRYRNAVVIGADTIVVLRGRLFGKPRDPQEAVQMLKSLSGKAHSVITGFTIIDTSGKKELSKAVESRVYFKSLSADEIEAYVSTGEPMDKAGAYGIQGLGAVIIRKIDGDFFNVMGLPLSALADSLRKFGINLLTR